MVTDRYQHVVHHPDVEALADVGRAEDLALIGIDNLPGCTPLEDTLAPRAVHPAVRPGGTGSVGRRSSRRSAQVCSIAMFGSTRSINAAVASGIAMHTWVRQHVPREARLTCSSCCPRRRGRPSDRRGRPLDLDDCPSPRSTRPASRCSTRWSTASSRDRRARGARRPERRSRPGRPEPIDLRTAPTLRVSDLYTGVLYDALDHRTLDATAKRRATRRLVVVERAVRRAAASATGCRRTGCRWGSTSPVSASWRRPGATRSPPCLPSAAGRGVVVDLRSLRLRRGVAARRRPRRTHGRRARRPRRSERALGRQPHGQAHPWPRRPPPAGDRRRPAHAGRAGRRARQPVRGQPRRQARRDASGRLEIVEPG